MGKLQYTDKGLWGPSIKSWGCKRKIFDSAVSLTMPSQRQIGISKQIRSYIKKPWSMK
jgi:hypothetical protein